MDRHARVTAPRRALRAVRAWLEARSAPDEDWGRVGPELGLHGSGPMGWAGMVGPLWVDAGLRTRSPEDGAVVEVFGIPDSVCLAGALDRALCAPHGPSLTDDGALPRSGELARGRVDARRLGALTRALRGAMIRCRRLGTVRSSGGRLELTVASRANPKGLVESVRAATELAMAVRPRNAIAHELRHAAENHPDPESRGWLLTALTEVSGLAAERTANVLLDDPDPRPRLVAAGILRDDATRLAIAIDPKVDRRLRTEAIRALPAPWLAFGLLRLEARDGYGLWAAALAAARSPSDEVLAALTTQVHAIAWGDSAEHRRAAMVAATVAAQRRNAGLADASVVFLQWDQLTEHVVHTLAVAGTVRSIPALQWVLDNGVGLVAQDIVHDAIAAIQARTGGTVGALALADVVGVGGLALAGLDGLLALGPHPRGGG